MQNKIKETALTALNQYNLLYAYTVNDVYYKLMIYTITSFPYSFFQPYKVESSHYYRLLWGWSVQFLSDAETAYFLTKILYGKHCKSCQ